MYSSFSNSYNEKNENLFDFNNLNINQNNRSIKPAFTNLRYYDNNNDFFNENINPFKFNENKNKSTIVAKKSNYRIQKDRFQKFVLNNSSSASTINPNKIALQPLTTSFKKTNINSTLRQKFLSNYNDYVFNAGKSEGNLLLSQSDLYTNPEYKSMNILNKFVSFPKHYIYNHFNGKRSTDITNNDIVDKYLPGNNREYLDYIHKKKEFELFNRRFLENKNNLRESERNKLILKERHQMDEANKYFKKAILKDALYRKKKKIYYRDELDNQMEHFLENKLVNENLPYSQFLKNKDYNRMATPMMKYLNKNDYFDVNPFNNKSLDLGKSNLKYDTILNPRLQFKTNRYLFPEIVKDNFSNYQS
jgi:hypothetical protein